MAKAHLNMEAVPLERWKHVALKIHISAVKVISQKYSLVVLLLQISSETMKLLLTTFNYIFHLHKKSWRDFRWSITSWGITLSGDPQEVYYYAVEHTGFEANPERTEGTYSKYASLDDRIDGFHYYTSFIKFGLGRATMDAAQEIRNGKITRDEGIALIRRYDGEFPERYFQEVLDYMGITEERFWQLINAARSPHLWTKQGDEWKLRHSIIDEQ